MLNDYSIKCFVKKPSNELKKIFIRLIEDHDFIIDKGWENGYHIHLRGKFQEQSMKKLTKELENGVSSSITDYDESLFIKKYAQVSRHLGKDNSSLNPVIKSKVRIKKENFILKSALEDKLFRKINSIFDFYFCRDYFQYYSLYDLIQEVLKFHKRLSLFEKKESRDSYNCHLSHYVAFIHNLNDKDKKKITYIFDKKFNENYKIGLCNLDLSPSLLTENLIDFFYDIRRFVKDGKLNFYMPYNDQLLKNKLKNASNAHKMTFSSENTPYFIENEIVIVNRWMTNALYKKILLLGLSNMDRFFLNYVISRYAYSEEEITKLLES